MRLIDFLLNNIVFVIIALGILSSVWKKKKGEQQRGNRPTMPPFGGDPDGLPMRIPQRPTPSIEREMRPEPSPIRRDEPQPMELQRPLVKATSVTEGDLAQPERGPLSEPVLATKQRVSPKPVNVSPLQADSDEVLRGLIWAQILSAPRSRKPYRS